MSELHPDIKSVILDEAEIRSICERIGAEITADYADKHYRSDF